MAAGDEIDVFAVGADYMGNEALWHKWIDQAGVHGQTEWDAQSGTHVETGNWKLVGGNYAAAPSIIGAARPGTVISGDNAQFTILNPNPDATVHLFVATKDSATQFDAGPSYGVPSRYKVSIDKIFVGNPRSLISDSDLGALTLQVGLADAGCQRYGFDLRGQQERDTRSAFFSFRRLLWTSVNRSLSVTQW